MPARGPAVLAVFAVLGATACAPSIKEFTALPLNACEGQPVNLSWQVQGSATLTADPPVPGLGSVASSASRSVTPHGTTVFKLTVRRLLKTAVLRRTVTILAEPQEQAFDFIPQQDEDGSLHAEQELSEEKWGELRVDTIANASARPLRVIHEGREVNLAEDGTPSEGLRGTPVTGTWKLYAHTVPGGTNDLLEVNIRLTCERGGSSRDASASH